MDNLTLGNDMAKIGGGITSGKINTLDKTNQKSYSPVTAIGDNGTGSKPIVKNRSDYANGVNPALSDRTGNKVDSNIKIPTSSFTPPAPPTPPAPQKPNPIQTPATPEIKTVGSTSTSAGTSTASQPAQTVTAPTRTTVSEPVTAPSPAPAPTPAPTRQTNEDILRFIPSKKQINEMSREELINLKSFLIKHCYQEAMQTYDIYNVKRFAKECFKTHNMVPVVLNQYYPDIITDNIQSVYSKLLELSNIEGSGENIKNAVQTQLDYTMKLFSNSTDWVGIVLSKKLGEWSPFFKNIGKFFMVAAFCASIVYLVKKFFKSKHFLGIGDKYDFSDSTNREYFDSRMKNFKEDVNAKLKEYMTKDIPTDVLMINSIILKAEAMSLGLLLSVAYQNLEEYNIPLNILVLTEICCSIVLLWSKLLGRKLKKSKSTSNLYDVISDKLSISMGINPNNPSRDIFSKLNKYSRSLSDEKVLS